MLMASQHAAASPADNPAKFKVFLQVYGRILDVARLIPRDWWPRFKRWGTTNVLAEIPKKGTSNPLSTKNLIVTRPAALRGHNCISAANGRRVGLTTLRADAPGDRWRCARNPLVTASKPADGGRGVTGSGYALTHQLMQKAPQSAPGESTCIPVLALLLFSLALPKAISRREERGSRRVTHAQGGSGGK